MKRLVVCVVVLLVATHLNAQQDTIRSYYLDKVGRKHTCSILVPTSKKEKQKLYYKGISVLDSLQNQLVLSPDACSGFDAGKDGFYKAFSRVLNGTSVSFFAKQLYQPRVEVCGYKGELFNGLPVYIYKKRSDTMYTYMYQDIYNVPMFNKFGSAVNSKVKDSWPIMFLDEKPYLDFVYGFFSDCVLVKSKRKSDRYGYSNIEAIFKDYNKCE